MHGYVVRPFGLRLLWPLLTSHSSLLLRLISPSVRSHGISLQSFLVCLPDLRTRVTVAFWTSLSFASLSAVYALYQVSVRQATILLSLLPACTSRYKPWESLWGSSATTPLVDFHHRLTACPSYEKTGCRKITCGLFFISKPRPADSTVAGKESCRLRNKPVPIPSGCSIGEIPLKPFLNKFSKSSLYLYPVPHRVSFDTGLPQTMLRLPFLVRSSSRNSFVSWLSRSTTL